MAVSDPFQYFESCHLVESQVLSFAFNKSLMQLRLDVNYAAEVVSQWFAAQKAGISLREYDRPPSDFRRFVFAGIRWVDPDRSASLASDARSTEWSTEWTQILQEGGLRLPTISSFSVTKAEDGLLVAIMLERMGSFSYLFKFLSLTVRRRLARFVRNEGDLSLWEDIDSRSVFDFYNPFSEEQGGGSSKP